MKFYTALPQSLSSLAIVIGVAFFPVGLASAKAANPPRLTTAAARPISGAAAAADNYRLPPVVAMINGSPLTRDEVDAELERENNWAQQVVFSLTLAKLIHQRASQLGLVPGQARIDEAFKQADFKVQGRLAMLLANNHMSRSEFERAMLRPQVEMENLKNHGVTVSDADIQQYYARNKAKWTTPEQVELYRLHVPTMDAANAALAELRAGTPWSAVFKKYSNDQPYYRNTEGFYGKVLRQVLPPEVVRAIAGVKVGGLSQPMQIAEEGPDQGYVIWRLSQVIGGTAPSLSEHREEIRRVLAATKAKSDLDVIGELVRAAHITGLPPGYQSMFAKFINPQPAPPPYPSVPPGFEPPPPPGQGGPPGGGSPVPPPPPPPLGQ